MSLIFISLLISLALAQFDVSIDIISQNPLELNFTVTNPQSVSQKFLRWGTPLEGVWTDMFDIRNDLNSRLDYIGIIVMRDEPIAEDFITLAGGSSISSIVNLGDNYDFSTVGQFSLKVDLPQYAQLEYSATNSHVETVFQLETIPPRKPIVGSPQGFTNCNANQISYANAAISGGNSESARAFNCLNGASCDSQYSRWFGTYADSNWNFVTPCFRNINSRLNSNFNGICDVSSTCASNVFAFVYPTDTTLTVHLCSLFFQRTADRNRVIVHEMSHFRAICGTQDYTYGTANCLSLARSNPSQASRNADNVCYFAGQY